jgi:hypothetical protein
MTVYAIGRYYIVKVRDKYRKAKLIDIPIEQRGNLDDIYVKYVYFSGGSESEAIIEDMGAFRAREVKRDPNCWQCKRSLNEEKNDICERCGWIICPDDLACGCNSRIK